MRLPYVAFVCAALLCAVAQVAILRSVIRSRAAVHDGNVPRPRPMVELVWALLPALALALVLAATWPWVRAHAERQADPTPVVGR